MITCQHADADATFALLRAIIIDTPYDDAYCHYAATLCWRYAIRHILLSARYIDIAAAMPRYATR